MRRIREETNERFDEVDENKDDFVSWEEYKLDAFGPDLKLDIDDQVLVASPAFEYFTQNDANTIVGWLLHRIC